MSHQAQLIEESPAGNIAAATDFGVWPDRLIPQGRCAWHPMVQRLYDYWSRRPANYRGGRTSR
jgi:hypothetical protein